MIARRRWIGQRAGFAVLVAICLCVGTSIWLLFSRNAGVSSAEANALIARYCVECHNPAEGAGSLRLDDKDVSAVAHDPEIWEHAVRKLKTGMMPPAGAARPDRATLDALTLELENRLDLAATSAPMPGHTTLRRLNGSEYANAIRDLLHLDIDAGRLLPLDDSSEGFDNIATALGVSPSLIEAYISAALKISRWSLGDPTTPRTQAAYVAPNDLRQDRHLEGLPLGTRGGLRIEHTFPLDAEYEISVRRGFRSARTARLDVTLDGRPLAVDNSGGIRVPVPAGPHVVTAAIVDTQRPVGVDDVYAEYAPGGGISGIEIDGPFAAAGVGDTPSRHHIMVCEPTSDADELACAEQIVSTLITRAFRRLPSREDIASIMDFFTSGHEQAGFEFGIQQAIARVLVDPRFLYRIEDEPRGIDVGTTFQVGDFDLASRLSFFLWSSIPDDELLGLASENRLSDPATLEAQVRRMLTDPKAESLVENFAAQWLFLRELESVTPDADDFDANLRLSMLSETKLLVETVIHEDMNILRLLDAPFTFVDERLAEHYGIPNVHGSFFRRIELSDDNPRRGLLGHASLLTVTSVTSRTSPVIRGAWILESLLGSPVPTPPPNVETTLEGDDGAAVATTVRERLEAHRRNPVCASCHEIMDPIGFSLESFDLIGAWRDSDGGRPIDSSARLADGTVLNGPQDLRAALLDRSDAFVTNATEKLLTYALGRGIEFYDMPTVRQIVREASGEDYRFSALVLGIVRSVPFQTRAKGEE
jgi:hypothetical protein